MKNLLFVLIGLFTFTGCGSDNKGGEVPITNPVKFTKQIQTLKYGESKLIDIDKEIKDCNFSIKDDFYVSISVNGNEAALNALKVGTTYIYAKYNDTKDSCQVIVEPKTSYFGSPLLTLGVSRDSVKSYNKNYQGPTIGGYTGEVYYPTSKSKVYYQFDSSDKLVAIKQILQRSQYSYDDVIISIKERFNYKSSSSAVAWYDHPNIMDVRIEKTTTEIIIRYATNIMIMLEHFPWE